MSALESAFRARFGRAPLRHEVEEIERHVARHWSELDVLTRNWREDVGMHWKYRSMVKMLHRSLQMLRIARKLKERAT
jgi:hypothetical protein